jgi:hypothetical protein
MADATRRTVWILGSGFSRSLGGPLLNELISLGGLRNVMASYPMADDLEDVQRMYNDGIAGGLWVDAEAFLDRLDVATEHADNSAPIR